MTKGVFVSYAQNLEDVILYRALKDVERGSYIDVGANDPVVDSVTKAFYERMWNGINIEPVAHLYEKLVKDRPRDINLQLAVSPRPGTIKFYDVELSGLSTSESQVAASYREEGRNVTERQVITKPLNTICDEYAARQVHFLKIDVEGGEASVLSSIDLNRWRPWVIVVEATAPNRSELVYEEWEHLVIEKNYSFVYFDGLNRFYLADEHRELEKAFSVPPNVFDNFVRYEDWWMWKCRSLRGQLKKIATSVLPKRLYELLISQMRWH